MTAKRKHPIIQCYASPEIVAKAHKLATHARRSVSSTMALMIEDEYGRVFGVDDLSPSMDVLPPSMDVLPLSDKPNLME